MPINEHLTEQISTGALITPHIGHVLPSITCFLYAMHDFIYKRQHPEQRFRRCPGRIRDSFSGVINTLHTIQNGVFILEWSSAPTPCA